MKVKPPSEEPRNHIEEAADLAFQAAEAYLKQVGSGLAQAFVILEAEPGTLPEREDQVAAAHNVEDVKDLVAMLAVHFIAAAESVGMQVKLFPMGGRGQG